MKLVTFNELLKMPRGTIFREFEPSVFHGDWCRFYEAIDDDDFFYSVVGPQVESEGRLVIDDWLASDGSYDDERKFVVLERGDVEAMVRQLQSEALA